MSGIVSSVGLVSGLPIQNLIDRLIDVESRPYRQVLARIETVQAQRAAYAELNARLLALKGAAGQFDRVSFFRRSTAISNRPEVLTATAAEGAVPGTYAFRVHSLVTSHQLISSGFADADQTAVGRGTVAVEVGNGRLGRRTFLDDLNGQQGVGRGSIEIQDRAGNQAEIDLTSVLTVDDVLERINDEPQVAVQAEVQGDRIVLIDTSGSTAANLTVRDLGSGSVAEDLGIRQSVAQNTLIGNDINDATLETRLSRLNDGNGVRHNSSGADLSFRDGGLELFAVELNDTLKLSTHLQQLNDGNGVTLGDFEIRTRSGDGLQVDLAQVHDFGDGLGPRGVSTIGDVITVINEAASAAGVAVQAGQQPGTLQLQLVDHTSGSGSLEVEDLNGSAAADLGLSGSADGGTLVSPKILRISSLGDVVRAINYAPGNYDPLSGSRQITAAVSGNGLHISRASGAEFTIEATNDSPAADDLGVVGGRPAAAHSTRPLLAGLNTVLLRSLNGGAGVSTGQPLVITARSGQTVSVDLSGAQTVLDVVREINAQAAAAGSTVRADLNSAGSGLSLTDGGNGSGPLGVAPGSIADDLGLGASARSTTDRIEGANLQLQYVSEATALANLPVAGGVGTGEFEITTAAGTTFKVQITQNQTTVGGVLSQINTIGESLGIRAEINSQGDGIVIRDLRGGAGELAIQDVSGAVARKLNLLRAAENDDGGQFIDGSYEFDISIDADDTLNDVADKINSAGLQASATVISDGSSANSYRLSVTSGVTGTDGTLMFDAGATRLLMSELVQPQDAVIFFGSAQSANPLVIRSSSNTLTNLVQDVTINLLGSSSEAVELTVSRDNEAIAGSIETFVNAYNGVMDRIEELTFFDSETLQSGPLRGDATVRTVQSRLRNLVTSSVPTDNPTIRRLSSIGVSVQNGGRLGFDKAKFQEVLAENPEAIEELFTLSELELQRDAQGNPQIDPDSGAPLEVVDELGLGYVIDDALDLMTRTFDGLLAVRDDALESQEALLSDRAEFLLALLDSRRIRLEAQFAGLEQTLSSLSGQTSALNLLSTSASQSLFGS